MGGSKPVRSRTGLGTLQACSGLAATTWSRPSLAATTGCPDGHASVTMKSPTTSASPACQPQSERLQHEHQHFFKSAMNGDL